MPSTSVSAPDVKAITVFLASTATPERGGLPYLDAVLPAEHRLAATRVVRDLGALPRSRPPLMRLRYSLQRLRKQGRFVSRRRAAPAVG